MRVTLKIEDIRLIQDTEEVRTALGEWDGSLTDEVYVGNIAYTLDMTSDELEDYVNAIASVAVRAIKAFQSPY